MSSLLQTEQTQVVQPPLICAVHQTSSHPGSPSLGSLQYIHVFLALGSPKLGSAPDVVSQVPNRGRLTSLQLLDAVLLVQPSMELTVFAPRALLTHIHLFSSRTPSFFSINLFSSSPSSQFVLVGITHSIITYSFFSLRNLS